MTAVFYFREGNSTYPYGAKWCGMHGSYYGDRCPYCSTVPYVQQTVTPSPDSTGAAFAAMVTALTNLINDLREQVAERDRQIQELKDQLAADT